MKIERSSINMLTITEAPALDRIKVVTEDFGPGQGQITIVCYGRAWTAYWGGMGSGDVTQFVISMSTGYIVENLLRGMQAGLKKDSKNEFRYLGRIVAAVQEALRVQLRIDLHGVPA